MAVDSSQESQPHGLGPPEQLREVPVSTRFEDSRANVVPSTTTRVTAPYELASYASAGAGFPPYALGDASASSSWLRRSTTVPFGPGNAPVPSGRYGTT